MYDGICGINGLRKLSTKREMFSVGEPLPDMMGLPGLSGLGKTWLFYSRPGRETCELSWRGCHGHAFRPVFVESPLKRCLLDQCQVVYN